MTFHTACCILSLSYSFLDYTFATSTLQPLPSRPLLLFVLLNPAASFQPFPCSIHWSRLTPFLPAALPSHGFQDTPLSGFLHASPVAPSLLSRLLLDPFVWECSGVECGRWTSCFWQSSLPPGSYTVCGFRYIQKLIDPMSLQLRLLPALLACTPACPRRATSYPPCPVFSPKHLSPTWWLPSLCLPLERMLHKGGGLFTAALTAPKSDC